MKKNKHDGTNESQVTQENMNNITANNSSVIMIDSEMMGQYQPISGTLPYSTKTNYEIAPMRSQQKYSSKNKNNVQPDF